MERAQGVTRRPAAILVMGVAGAGKSTVGARLASELALPFIEADDLHPPANVAAMRAGVALTDADRWPWLDAVAAAGRAAVAPPVIACSALKRAYRDRLREALGEVAVVFLAIDPATAEARVATRADHYMPASLIPSQFAALEPPGEGEWVVPLDAVAVLFRPDF